VFATTTDQSTALIPLGTSIGDTGTSYTGFLLTGSYVDTATGEYVPTPHVHDPATLVGSDQRGHMGYHNARML
jgi:hypothetical protein